MPEAWARYAATVQALPLPPDGFRKVDAVALAGAVEAAVPRAACYRPRLLALPDFDVSWLDELPSLARVVRWGALEARLQPVEAVIVGPALAEAGTMRRKLTLAISSKRALLGQLEPLPRPGRGRSTAKHATALEGLVITLRSLGTAGTAVTERDLEAAEELVVRLAILSDPRQRVPLAALEASASRAKALGLMIAVYGEVRMGVCYLARHEVGGDQVLPSLWGMRGPRVGRREAK